MEQKQTSISNFHNATARTSSPVHVYIRAYRRVLRMQIEQFVSHNTKTTHNDGVKRLTALVCLQMSCEIISCLGFDVSEGLCSFILDAMQHVYTQLHTINLVFYTLQP